MNLQRQLHFHFSFLRFKEINFILKKSRNNTSLKKWGKIIISKTKMNYNFKMAQNKIFLAETSRILWNTNIVLMESFIKRKNKCISILSSLTQCKYKRYFWNNIQIRCITTGNEHRKSKEVTDVNKFVYLITKLKGLTHNINIAKKNNIVEKRTTLFELTELLKDSKMPEETKKRLMVAFSEGYMAALNDMKLIKRSSISSNLLKYLKAIRTLLGIFLVVSIFSTLFYSSPLGRTFKVQFGEEIKLDPEQVNVKFSDVEGCDEAKEELKQVVEFLKNPQKFSNLGGKLPKGVLLVGPPGTGKTLLARAVAGEAGVPFFQTAGSEFNEVFVGQGAKRVRELFIEAKKKAPCVIFIDEIDSVGSKRANAVLHPYANQTINQLLTEMDGFRSNEGVIVLGATNRREDLDEALLRPGRFDVEVYFTLPDFCGRTDILRLYLNKIQHSDIDIDKLARGTTGFTGADLENMVNQAALRAGIEGAETVTMRHLELAREKFIMGPVRNEKLQDEETNKITAYHESGHAIVAFYTKESPPIYKVTIIPSANSLGHTSFIPEKERYYITKAQLLAMIDTMMGGRAAEEIIFGSNKITASAGDDLKNATLIASNMVKKWGMSKKFGLRSISEQQSVLEPSESIIGKNIASIMDKEISKILSDSYNRAKSILKAHAEQHKILAEALLKYETLDADDIKVILTGNTKAQGNSKKCHKKYFLFKNM